VLGRLDRADADTGQDERDGEERDGRAVDGEQPDKPGVRKVGIGIGLRRFGDQPFLVVLRNHCTVQSLDEPIGAITAEGNHHMLVKPGRTVDDCQVQMISLQTKARAQRFPDDHVFQGNTAAELTRQVGNAAYWLAQRVLPSLN
jgi:DNA (cytosine-5)-methyltransferase 1